MYMPEYMAMNIAIYSSSYTHLMYNLYERCHKAPTSGKPKHTEVWTKIGQHEQHQHVTTAVQVCIQRITSTRPNCPERKTTTANNTITNLANIYIYMYLCMHIQMYNTSEEH